MTDKTLINNSKSGHRMSFKTRKLSALVSATLLAGLLFTGAASASNVSFNFGIGFGSGGVNAHSGGHPHGGGNLLNRPHSHRTACMNNAGVTQYLRGQGFNDIRYVNETYQNKAKFTVLSSGWRYSLLVDRCTGTISNVQPVPTYGHGQHPQSTPNTPFGLFDRDFPFGGLRDFPGHSD